MFSIGAQDADGIVEPGFFGICPWGEIAGGEFVLGIALLSRPDFDAASR